MCMIGKLEALLKPCSFVLSPCASLCSCHMSPGYFFCSHLPPINCRAPFLCLLSQPQLKHIFFVNGSHRLGLQTPSDNESCTHGKRAKKIRLGERALYVPAHTYTDLFFLFLSLCFYFSLQHLKGRKYVRGGSEKCVQRVLMPSIITAY